MGQEEKVIRTASQRPWFRITVDTKVNSEKLGLTLYSC